MFKNNDQEVSHYGQNLSKCGQKLDNDGQEVYHGDKLTSSQERGKQLSVFETFFNGQTVFKYGSKRVQNTFKQCSKSGQPGVSQGSPWGHQGVK